METKWKPNGNQINNTTKSLISSSVTIFLFIESTVVLEYLQVTNILYSMPSYNAPPHIHGALLHEYAPSDFVPNVYS